MKYHSTISNDRHAEFARVLALASDSADQVLIMSPDRINSLEDYLSKTFGEAFAKKLFKDRKLNITDDRFNVTYFLEANNTKSGFQKGNIFMPWASQHTWQAILKDRRGNSTFFIPHAGPDSEKNELALYLRDNGDSIKI